MAKRRNVIMGLGALAFGSGALSSVAGFSGDLAEPESDFRVIADAALRVRSARDGSDNPIVSGQNPASEFGSLGSSDLNVTDDGYSSDYSTFESDNLNSLISDIGSPAALGTEINQQANDNLAIRLGLSLRLDDNLDPFIEIQNQSDTNYNIGINYAENDGSNNISNGNNGYGSNVYTPNDGSDATANDISNNEVSRQLVQTVYQWRLDGADYNGRNDVGSLSSDAGSDGDLISPDPSTTTGDPDETDTTVTLSSGELIMVKLDFNTTSTNINSIDVPGQINSAAGGGGSSPWATNDLVDLLDKVYIQAD